MNKDQVKGRARQTEGAIKESAGKLTQRKGLELKGKMKQAAGKVQARFGDLRSHVRKAR